PRLVPELDGAIALFLARIDAGGGCMQFGAEDVDARPGEVGDPAGVVGIEVGEDDVPHLLAPKAEPFHLPCSGLHGIEPGPSQREQRLAEPRRGLFHVVESEPRVHEHQAPGGIDQQDVADQARAAQIALAAVDELSAGRAEGGAVEVVDSHAGEDRSYPRRLQAPEPERAAPSIRRCARGRGDPTRARAAPPPARAARARHGARAPCPVRTAGWRWSGAFPRRRSSWRPPACTKAAPPRSSAAAPRTGAPWTWAS